MPLLTKLKDKKKKTGGSSADTKTDTNTETGGSSPGGASTGGVGSGIGGAGTGGAATGGASTGGAGTVNVTISGNSGTGSNEGGGKQKKPGAGKGKPTTINISNVGGRTDAGSVASGDGPGAGGSGGSGKGSGGGGGGAAPDEPKNFSTSGKDKQAFSKGGVVNMKPFMNLKDKKKHGDESTGTEKAGGDKHIGKSLAIAYGIQNNNKKKKMAYGGEAQNDRNPGTPAKKPDDRRLDKNDYMSNDWAGGPDPIRKPDDERRPKAAFMDTNEWSDGEAPSRTPFNSGGTVTDHSTPRPSQMSIESEDLDARAARHGMTHEQMAERYEQEAAKHRMYYDGGEVDGSAEATQEPPMPGAKPDDDRRPKTAYLDTEIWSDGEEPSRAPFAKGGVAQAIMRKKKMADGGMVDDADSRPHHTQLGYDAIKKELYADGGMVDLEEESEEAPNEYDELNAEAGDAEQYDDEQISAQPMDSNEEGHAEEDEHDKSITAAIRRKMASKRGM